MEKLNAPLLDGYAPVPPGKLANVTTCLQMLERPQPRPTVIGDALTIERWEKPTIEEYRALYRAVGEPWLWMSRLVMANDELSAILADPAIEIFTPMVEGRRAGLLELDFRATEECELAFFGLIGDAIGRGAGRQLMNRAIDEAWSRPIRRFWVHTCSFDHPAALAFYMRSGFTPYEIMVEVHDDPRLTGAVARDVAPHVPLIVAKPA